jgi:hypothetical protein
MIYLSDWDGDKPLIVTELEALPLVDDGEGNMIPQWQSFGVLTKRNIAGSNKCIVEVVADESVHTLFAKDARFSDAGKRADYDTDGNPTADKTKFDNLRATHHSDERQRKHKVQKKLDRVNTKISRTETIIARKDAYRGNREAKRVALVALKQDLQDIRDGTFTGDVDAVVVEVDSIFENTKAFRSTVDDVLTITPKEDILKGIAKGRKGLINTLIRADNGINTRIDNHVEAKQELIDEIAVLQKQLDGTLDEGDNLETVKAQLEIKLGAFK